MPSSRRSTRSPEAMPMTACSAAWAALALSGPPRQTASHARPPESTSRLAHCWAKSTGWRCTNVARQPTASRTRSVTPASADSSVTDSSRGLASRLSPTHTASNTPERSASAAMSSRSRAFTAPSTTARLARISPSEAATLSAPGTSAGACRGTSARPLRSRASPAATRRTCARARARCRAARRRRG